MPKYRKLHTKIVESLDVNDMPSDFARLTWTLLPLALCREGRGLYNMSWLKSKIHPLRTDVKKRDMQAAFDWYIKRGMVITYAVAEREYFYVPTWKDYQGETTREAESIYPSPEEADVTQELVTSRLNHDSVGRVLNIESTSESESEYESESKANGDKKKSEPIIPEKLNVEVFITSWERWQAYRREKKKTLTKTTITAQLNKLSKYTPQIASAMLEQSIENGWQGIFELKDAARAPAAESQEAMFERLAREED